MPPCESQRAGRHQRTVHRYRALDELHVLDDFKNLNVNFDPVAWDELDQESHSVYAAENQELRRLQTPPSFVRRGSRRLGRSPSRSCARHDGHFTEMAEKMHFIPTHILDGLDSFFWLKPNHPVNQHSMGSRCFSRDRTLRNSKWPFLSRQLRPSYRRCKTIAVVRGRNGPPAAARPTSEISHLARTPAAWAICKG